MNEQQRGPEGEWPEEDESVERREAVVPDHEIDRRTSVGGGVVAAGGTAINRAAGAGEQPGGQLDAEPNGEPPAHLDEDDEAVMDEPNRWVFGGRSG